MTDALDPSAPPRSGQTRVALRLAHFGFLSPSAGELLADQLGWWDTDRNGPVDEAAGTIIAALGRAADPDQALAALAVLVAALPDPDRARLVSALGDSPVLRARLLGVLGASVAFGEYLAAAPEDWRVLLEDRAPDAIHPDPAEVVRAVGADPSDPATGTGGTRATGTDAATVDALRRTYRRELLAIAGRDLGGELDLQAVTEQLAELASWTLRAALAVAAAGLRPDAAPCRLAVIAMGKAGARELNYVSDVDVVFVAGPVEDEPPAAAEAVLATATRLAAELMRIGAAVAWEVDANLRPEGKDGPLVRTLASHEAYYQRWASTWEFQALLKARPVAGDPKLGQDYLELIAPMVWHASERDGFVPDVQAMRRRVLARLPAAIAPRELKLGPGGLRDVEFAVQLLQLVHGRADGTLREAAGTLPALDALRDGGYVGLDDALSLHDAYVFLRGAEHRVQLWRMRRTHLVPDDEAGLHRLARAMGYRPDARGDSQAVWQAEWSLHVREVRRLHEKLFYRPLLEAVARVPEADLRLTPQEAGRRLAALGFADPRGALHHIEALTAGLSRRAALQRTLLPVMLGYFSEAPDPDAGLRAYRQVSDALGTTPWFLRLLRDEGAVASRLAYLLGTSAYVATMLVHEPEALQLLADDADLPPRPVEELRAATIEAAARQADPSDAVAVIRAGRRRELLRTAFADLLGLLDVEQVGAAISVSTDVTLQATLDVVQAAVAEEFGYPDRLPIDFAVIAMGRLGGSEVSYGSDADVLFVYDQRAGTEVAEPGELTRIATRVAERLRTWLAAPSSAAPLAVDADLRPEGRDGPLVRSLASYASYYARWSSPWEAQALLRARPVAGDEGLATRFIELIDPLRYPPGGLSSAAAAEIRRVKGRVDAERLPRGADPWTHLKLGRGGLSDVEWTVQLLALQHAHEVPGLRTPHTLDPLRAAAQAGLISAADAEALVASWRWATGARNAIMLVRDRADDQLPAQGPTLVAVGRALGYPAGFDPGSLIDDYRRTARHARRVVERVFYGVEDE